jgi:hypothetical protein
MLVPEGATTFTVAAESSKLRRDSNGVEAERLRLGREE